MKDSINNLKHCWKTRLRFSKNFKDLEDAIDGVLQVFSYEFCEIFKDTFFTEHLWLTTSEKWTYMQVLVWESMSWGDSSTIISYQQLSNRTLTILQLLDKFDKVFTMELTSITPA